jgi:hypothetical protein
MELVSYLEEGNETKQGNVNTKIKGRQREKRKRETGTRKWKCKGKY